jgi:hypothetical protein
MSVYEVIDLIKIANNVQALSYIEEWINESNDRHSGMLAEMALIKRCEIIATQYSETE